MTLCACNIRYIPIDPSMVYVYISTFATSAKTEVGTVHHVTVAPLVSSPREGKKMDRKGLPKVQDAEKESLYGFVFAVSGPGAWRLGSRASNIPRPVCNLQPSCVVEMYLHIRHIETTF